MDSLISTNSTTSIVGSINSPIPPPTTIATATTITSSKPFIRLRIYSSALNSISRITTNTNSSSTSNLTSDLTSESNPTPNQDSFTARNNSLPSSRPISKSKKCNRRKQSEPCSTSPHYCSQEYQRIYGNSDGNLRTENTEFSILLDYCNQEYHRTTITITNMICPDYYYSTTLNQYVDVNKLSRLVKYGNEEYLREFSN
nr:8032_t:CDS:2 [Entrophospora candida]